MDTRSVAVVTHSRVHRSVYIRNNNNNNLHTSNGYFLSKQGKSKKLSS